MGQEVERGGVIPEFVRLGVIRVSAMDEDSLTEVVLQGPAAAGEAALRRAVLRKLAYALARSAPRPTPVRLIVGRIGSAGGRPTRTPDPPKG